MSLGLTALCSLFLAHAAFSGGLVPRGKPDLFLHAAVVEDIVSSVSAAVAAGMRVIGYAADNDEMTLRSAGAELLHTLAQLPKTWAI